jgi:hypothetical protein
VHAYREDHVKLHRIRIPRVAIGTLLLAAAIGITAPPALAAAPSVTGTVSGGPVAPGVDASLSFTISPSSRTLASFTLSSPTGWKLRSVDSGPAVLSGNTISATGLSVTSSNSVTVGFTVGTGCVAGNAAWGLEAFDTQGRQYGNDASVLSTVVNDGCHLAITTQPSDAQAGQTITNTDFNSSGGNVQVTLQNGANATVDYFPVMVSFDLKKNGIAASGLSVTPQTTDSGVATFGTGTLSVSVPNEALYTDYTLAPKSTDYPSIVGSASDPFDIWETTCAGSCHVTLRNGNDDYTSNGVGHLRASRLIGALPGLVCPGQTLIFSDTVFESEADTAGGPIQLKSHVTRQDMKASANNGQAHVQWCVGLPAPVSNGGTYIQRDTNGDGHVGAPYAEGVGPDLFVGFAPACPNMSPAASAPCITRQYGDGNGGSYTEGWLPPDPPRKT